jgi:hypothetical protein
VSSFAIALAVFGGSTCAAIIGMVLNVKLPDRHLDSNSKEVVKLVMGLVATMSALVLSLLIASASTTYDRQSSELKSLAVNILQLDQTLESYGPGARAVRDRIRDAVRQTHDRIWSPDGVRTEYLNSAETRTAVKAEVEMLHGISPTTDIERMMQSRAIELQQSISQARLLMFEQLGSAIPWPFLTVLIFWICMLFLGFGLFSSPNPTVTVALLVGSLSVACAIFLILELNAPLVGLVRISDAPLRNVIALIDQ